MQLRRFVTVALVVLAFAGCRGGKKAIVKSDGLVIEELLEGKKVSATRGDLLTVHYVGTLDDGTTFESTYDRGRPLSFRLGGGQVPIGLERGIAGMGLGGKRRLTIPPALGYGTQSIEKIPSNSTLHYDVELVSIAPR